MTSGSSRRRVTGTAGSLLATLFLAVLAAAPAALLSSNAHADTLDLSKSSISAVVKQLNVPIEGKFKTFTAQVDYDPAHAAAGSASIGIDIASFDLGDPEYNEQTRDPTWFDAKKYPQASFQSSAVSSAGPGKISVAGRLTIKGKTLDVTVPVTVTSSAAGVVYDGALPIRRLQFDIGSGEWKDTSVVADEVVIKFHLVMVKR